MSPHSRCVAPLRQPGSGETPSRKRIYSCYPKNAAEEDPCARQVLQRMAERAFRRPIDAADMQDLVRFYAEGKRIGGFEAGIRHGLTAILADPDFLYRTERPAGDLQRTANTTFRLDDLDLASRLSFFLWSSVPDAELLAAAERGELRLGQELEHR